MAMIRQIAPSIANSRIAAPAIAVASRPTVSEAITPWSWSRLKNQLALAPISAGVTRNSICPYSPSTRVENEGDADGEGDAGGDAVHRGDHRGWPLHGSAGLRGRRAAPTAGATSTSMRR
jgi:hypothetical protein